MFSIPQIPPVVFISRMISSVRWIGRFSATSLEWSTCCSGTRPVLIRRLCTPTWSVISWRESLPLFGCPFTLGMNFRFSLSDTFFFETVLFRSCVSFSSNAGRMIIVCDLPALCSLVFVGITASISHTIEGLSNIESTRIHSLFALNSCLRFFVAANVMSAVGIPGVLSCCVDHIVVNPLAFPQNIPSPIFLALRQGHVDMFHRLKLWGASFHPEEMRQETVGQPNLIDHPLQRWFCCGWCFALGFSRFHVQLSVSARSRFFVD